MPAYTAEPQTFDTTLVVGDSWLVQVTLEDADGVAISLSGATGSANLRTEPGGRSIATPTVTVTSAASGQFEISLAAASTASLVPGTYRYACRITWGDGTVRTVIEGRLTVRKVAI